MARFGLVDSDDESARSASSSRSPAHSPGPDDASFTSHTSDEFDDNDDDDEDAPPRESLQDDSMDADSQLSADDDDDDDRDASFDDDGQDDDERTTRSESVLSRRSRSYSTQAGDADLSLNSGSPSPRAPSRRLLRPLASSSTPQPRPPRQPAWSAAQQGKRTAGLEAKRVAVMQASFFGQGAALDQMDDEDERDRDAERAQEQREAKRRAVEKGLASRTDAAQPAPAAAAPAPAPLPAIDPAPFRPHRTYERVPLASSVTTGREGNLVDAGLSLGRSFRVGWGPNGELVSLRGVYGSKKGKEASDSLQVERLQLLSSNDSASAIRLLKLQLAHTEIFPPSDDASAPAPLAVPSSALRFSHFVDLFSSPSSSSDTSTSTSASESQLFKLASVLFDEVPNLALPSDEALTPQQAEYITSLRRRAQLSAWLEASVRTDVEAALRSLPPTSSTSSGAARIFALLTGHQIPRACTAALESSNMRLATLLSQAGSASAFPPDEAFQADLFLQLSKWREYGVDGASFVDPAYRRVLELLSGNLGVSAGRAAKPGEEADRVDEMHVLQDLGWKQALAMGLWYAGDAPSPQQRDAGVADAVKRYEAAFAADARVAPPTPAYLLPGSPPAAETEGQKTWSALPSERTAPPRDPAFHLLKLFTSPTHALELALAPRNFGPSPLDYRLPWHLYLMLSRVLRRRDWEDRVELDRGAREGGDERMRAGEGEGEREGNSVRADQVTVAYAMQLEQLGLWEWAAFVLLHVELESCRVKAIQELLSRHVDALESEEQADLDKIDFLVETLKIPRVWLDSALADRALSDPLSRFRAYELLLSAQRPAEAHFIATTELVPEAIIRNDGQLAKRLLSPFLLDRSLAVGPATASSLHGTVEGWETGGKVYLLYLATLSGASAALSPDHPAAAPALADDLVRLVAQTVAAVQAFAKRTGEEPRTRKNRMLRLACEEMLAKLVVLAKASAGTGSGVKALERVQPSTLAESDRATWIQGANRSFWEQSVGKALAA
ncbi:hypothetical protein Rhopal_007509-T1 [Rhodotorula paludigena]|uniref:Nuclear pore complex protein NUP96 C-terminal domain-containing protein n=1 Tax=Rhodotorula paludigena TaxID=86838 RepID=A0AAV5GYZ6_9BASI|nr:hypothetical protein Rhopal_007509-T1 [Rhodotorula paludigena]